MQQCIATTEVHRSFTLPDVLPDARLRYPFSVMLSLRCRVTQRHFKCSSGNLRCKPPGCSMRVAPVLYAGHTMACSSPIHVMAAQVQCTRAGHTRESVQRTTVQAPKPRQTLLPPPCFEHEFLPDIPDLLPQQHGHGSLSNQSAVSSHPLASVGTTLGTEFTLPTRELEAGSAIAEENALKFFREVCAKEGAFGLFCIGRASICCIVGHH